MIALIFCAGIGALQTLLLSVVLKGALGGKMKETVVAFLIKFLTYGIGFAVLYFFFLDDIYYAAAGFIVGAIVSFSIVAVKGIKESKKTQDKNKGDDANGRS